MTVAEHYSYRTSWSAEDGEFVGTVAEFPSLSWLAGSPIEAFTGITALVQDVLVDMAAAGEDPPVPIADRHYSGRFQVRIPPEAHRRLVTEAAEQNISLNRLASERLSA